MPKFLKNKTLSYRPPGLKILWPRNIDWRMLSTSDGASTLENITGYRELG